MINGQKMACAPCIRGHRSTKCNHSSERIMVPVRKPGRPLSTCPCPPGKPCACGGVKVAIPRKQKCGCEPESGTGNGVVEGNPSPTSPPTSPTRSAFRVAKASNGSRSNGRKQSYDPSQLQRMVGSLVTPHSGSIDANAMPMTGNGLQPQMPLSNLTGFGPGVEFVPRAPPGNGFTPSQNLGYGTPVPYPMDIQYAPGHHLSQEVKNEEGVVSSRQSNGLGSPTRPVPFSNDARNASLASLTVPHQPAGLGTPLLPKSSGATNGGSCCCGPKDEGPELHSGNIPQQQPLQSDFSQQYLEQYAPPVDLKPQPMPAPAPYGYPTIFTYPAQYGSWQHPMEQSTWQEMSSQPNMTMGPPMLATPNGAGADHGMSHECTCGAGCQCLGCLAHPFNDQTLQYVNNAYNGTSANGGVGSGSSGTPTRNGNTAPASPDSQAASDGSAANNEQSLSTADYFFVNIPLRMDGGCLGSMDFCPCGDDCDCIGCSLHNNADDLALPASSG